MGEAGTGHLSLHDCSCEEALASHQVLVEQLHDDVGDVRDINFVHDSIDTLAEHLPHVLLTLFCGSVLLLHLFKNRSHLERWHVDPTGV